ncbi:MAG: pyridoxamine 5'-phosphate oxidase family protein [Candidatus Aenigmarchaeota archaeon]|nr:pyridoxamine 5'-phosphate oxidase family protein [Candidatus Aenigmarchaeota archaeon]
MKENLRKSALRYMESVKIMTLATSDKSIPWASVLFYAFDKQFNIYFLSRHFRRHSIEISKNPRVAGTIVKPQGTFNAPNTGIQFEGSAKMLDGKELEFAYKIFMDRYPSAKKTAASAGVLGAGEVRMYKIKPHRLILQDQKRFPKEQRATVLER